MSDVRLSQAEIDTILAEAKRVFGAQLACVRLHGSRTDLTQNGGDIDLAIEVFGPIADRFALTRSLRLALSARLGEQKFDILLLSTDSSLNSDRENTFFALILGSSKVLWSAHGYALTQTT